MKENIIYNNRIIKFINTPQKTAFLFTQDFAGAFTAKSVILQNLPAAAKKLRSENLPAPAQKLYQEQGCCLCTFS